VYLGGLHFLGPIHVGDLVELHAMVIRTGRTSLDVSLDVYARDPKQRERRRTGHCVMVFVALDGAGRPCAVPPWQPAERVDLALESYAQRMGELRRQMDAEMEQRLGALVAGGQQGA
jgi:acyl-CoA hydrolase